MVLNGRLQPAVGAPAAAREQASMSHNGMMHFSCHSALLSPPFAIDDRYLCIPAAPYFSPIRNALTLSAPKWITLSLPQRQNDVDQIAL